MVHARQPTPAEMHEQARWMAAKFPSAEAVRSDQAAGLEVLANHDWVLHNAVFGGPFHLGGKVYHRGLFCHAPSKIVVRLGAPGKTFSAVVGVDTNRFTAGGKGSIVFGVVVGEKERFRSGVLREGMGGVDVNVDLGGAREFVIAVEDAGDGIACDTADWAEANVTLQDGRTMWLGDLPILKGQDGLPYDKGVPFSFIYDGKPSAELLGTWRAECDRRRLDDARSQVTLKYTDPKTGLEVRCVAVQYLDFPTVEWTVYFANTGSKDMPILADIHALDATFQRYPFPHPPMGEFTLHHHRGDFCKPNSYEPLTEVLLENRKLELAPTGGRPTNGQFPYLNLEWLSEGVILAVGWPGQWAAAFTRDGKLGLNVRAGQAQTHLKLHPGEQIRTPLVAVQLWKGQWTDAQNVWRRWMMTHSMPKPGGKLPPPIALGSSYRVYHEMQNATEQNQIMFIDRYLAEDLKIDYWWMDAGWYVNGHERGWPHVGTWEVDPKRFPKGFKPISDHAHAKGIKILVWFEPERVAADTWLTQHHPEWILGGAKGGLLNLGHPDARAWLTDHVDKLLTEQGIDLYRQDFNMDPLNLWRANDAEDRQGITEIKHVTGYLAYWDELIRRHPNMLIDTCASGGRRLDLETLRRAVPLWRSDYGYEPVGNQSQTYGLSFWLPFYGAGNLASSAGYYGAGAGSIDLYAFWSTCYPSNNFPFDMRAKDNDYEAIRELFRLRRMVVPNFYGDYYPLTPYRFDDDGWVGWQFDRPEAGSGVVLMFRRRSSRFEVGRWSLRAVDPTLRYRLRLLGTDQTWEMTGEQMRHEGVRIPMHGRPGAAVIVYERTGAES